jgi:hypothetical protein
MNFKATGMRRIQHRLTKTREETPVPTIQFHYAQKHRSARSTQCLAVLSWNDAKVPQALFYRAAEIMAQRRTGRSSEESVSGVETSQTDGPTEARDNWKRRLRLAFMH